MPWADSPEFLTGFQTFYLDGAPYTVESARVHKSMVLAKLRGVDDLEAAQLLRGKILKIDRTGLKLEDGAVFIADLIGMKVSTDEGEELGTLSDVMQTGANDVYVISMTDGEEVLIPAIKDCIRDVNVEQGQMCVHLLPGLLDINRK